jgi:hypothetical protein
MDKRIDKIIDRLLDDCLNDGKIEEGDPDLHYSELSEKDLLNITQNFLEFQYPKMTRTGISDPGKKQPLPYPEKKED